MNIKIIVGLIVVMVAGGFTMGCTEAPSAIEEIDEFAEVDNILDWEVVEIVAPEWVVEVVKVIDIVEVVGVVTTPTPTPIPEDVREYYTYKGVQKYAGWEVYDTVTLYLIETGEDIAWYYQMDVFDCSEMSAAYERAFENAGYNAKICYGYGDNGGHAWVAVEKEDGHWLFFEATAQLFLPQSEYIEYIGDCGNFVDINEAMEEMPFEFNWWFTLDDFDDVRWK